MSNEDYQTGYPGDEEEFAFSESNASSAGQIDEAGHLQTKDLWGVQTKIFNINVPTGSTLENLQANHKNGVYWDMTAAIKSHLRQVNKTRDRTNAIGDEMVGELGKVLFLSADVLSEHSDCAKALDITIPGLVPSCYSEHGRCNWQIPSGNGISTPVGESIFNPDNLFTKHMYEHNQKCDLKSLKEHINMDFDPTKQVALMESKGVGWKVLTDNMAIGEYADAADSIYEMNRHIFDNPDSRFSHAAKVPYAIAAEVFEAIAEPLREIEQSYTDLNSFRVRFLPSDGNAWNYSEGLIGESMGFDSESKGFEKETLVNKPINAGIRLRVSYVVNN